MVRKLFSFIIVIAALLGGSQFLDLKELGLEFLDLEKYNITSIGDDIRKVDIDKFKPAKTVSQPVGIEIPNHPGFPTIAGDFEIVEHTHYTLSYNEKYEQPNWVMYSLTKDMLKPSKFKRRDDFRADPTVDSGSATKKDYIRSGYDRGHLVPAADMKFTKEALSETFYMSNMSPQSPGFNRGIWKELEAQVREWARNDDDLYVIVGPVFDDEMKQLGKNEVAIPNMYYKIIVDLEEPNQKAIAFLMKNEKLDGGLFDYNVSIDSIEIITGIDFFPELPDDFENWLESTVDEQSWAKK